jgi:hypothetical protein
MRRQPQSLGRTYLRTFEVASSGGVRLALQRVVSLLCRRRETPEEARQRRSQLGHLATLAPALAIGAAIAVVTPTVLMIRRHYRHVAAGVLVLAVMLGLLAAAVHRYGNPVTIAFVVSPTPSAMADSASPQ